jgi:predicted N-acetyltransferase YhbS
MQLVRAVGPVLDQILDSSYALWGEGLSRRAYEQYNVAQQKTAWGSRHLHRVALVDGGRVLSSAKRYELDALLDGEAIRILGIGAVFTPPEHRGRGYAGKLIERLLEDGSRGGFAAALLFSEIGEEYYARLGFAPIPVQTLELGVARHERRGAPAVGVRSGEPADLSVIAEIAARRAGPGRFLLRRAAEWIEYGVTKKRLLAGMLAPGSRNVQFFVVEEGGRPVAWVVLVRSGRSLLLEECGDLDPSGARVGALLQVLLAGDAEVAPSIRGWLPPGWLPPQLSIRSSSAGAELMMMKGLRPGTPRQPPSPGEVCYWHGDVF